METQGGLEMEDRHFYTGFINRAGTLIKGKAAKWKMVDWLIEKLDEIAVCGYQKEIEETSNNETLAASLPQELSNTQDEVSSPSHLRRGELCWNKKKNKMMIMDLILTGSSNSDEKCHR